MKRTAAKHWKQNLCWFQNSPRKKRRKAYNDIQWDFESYAGIVRDWRCNCWGRQWHITLCSVEQHDMLTIGRCTLDKHFTGTARLRRVTPRRKFQRGNTKVDPTKHGRILEQPEGWTITEAGVRGDRSPDPATSCNWTGPYCNESNKNLKIGKPSTSTLREKYQWYRLFNNGERTQVDIDLLEEIEAVYNVRTTILQDRALTSQNSKPTLSIENVPYSKFCLQPAHKMAECRMIPYRLRKEPICARIKNLKSFPTRPAKSYKPYRENPNLLSLTRMPRTPTTWKSGKFENGLPNGSQKATTKPPTT